MSEPQQPISFNPGDQQPYGRSQPESQHAYPPYGQSGYQPRPPYYGYVPPRPHSSLAAWAVVLIAIATAFSLMAAVALVPAVMNTDTMTVSINNSNGTTGDGSQGGDGSDTPGARPDSVDAAFNDYYTQSVTWKSCAQGDACATLKAPSDWSDAKSTPISLHLAIHHATKESKGTLFINPGGPGASGADFLNDFLSFSATNRLKENYDIVGFDPRGVGDSTAVSCGTDTSLLDDYFLAPPATDKNLQQLRSLSERFAKACRDSSPDDIVDHADTQSVARDLDMMRAVLGSDHLDYLGFSYGTFIGATYAALFPEQTGRLVLDGAVDPQEDTSEQTINQSVGFENALKAYLKDCIDNDGSCPFKGGTVDQAVKQIQSWLERADSKPWPASGGDVNSVALMYGIITPLYSQDNWTFLTQAFTEMKSKGTATTMLLLANTYLDREPGGGYKDNSMQANLIVNCLDDPPTSDMARQKQIAKELSEKSPTFGRFMAYGNIGCDALKQDRSHLEKLDFSAKGAAPIVVVGTTGDPATPYQSAVNLAKQLDSGVLVTYKGEGHTAYSATNVCVANAVDDYLIDGTVPKDGTTCQ